MRQPRMSFDTLRNWMLGRGPDQRELFDVLNTGVWMIDAALNTQYVNPHMAALLDRTAGRDAGRGAAVVRSCRRARPGPRVLRRLRTRRRAANGDSRFFTRTVPRLDDRVGHSACPPSANETPAFSVSSSTSPAAAKSKTRFAAARPTIECSRRRLRTTSS